MTVKQRLLAIRLSEHIRRQPEYAKHIGLVVEGPEDGCQVVGLVKEELVSKTQIRSFFRNWQTAEKTQLRLPTP